MPHDRLQLTAPAADGAAPAAAASDTPSRAVAVEPLLLTAAQAARLCGVSVPTWYRMVSAGRCPVSVRPSPGCMLWRAEELREWIAAGCPDRRTWEGLRSGQTSGRRS